MLEESQKQKNSREIVKSIQNFFVDRNCMVMRRPVNDEKTLQKLHTVKTQQ